MKLRWTKTVYEKMWYYFIINLDQERLKIEIKKETYERAYALYEGRELTLNAFRSGIFTIKETQRKGWPSNLATWLKILTPKQMPQRLPIAIAQVKAGNVSENVRNGMR